MKFGRKYTCEITNKTKGQQITIQNLTCEFNIKKGIGAGLNNGIFKFFNLSTETRRLLEKDRFNRSINIRISFQAGYTALTTCFSGSVLESFSTRQGADIVTEVQARDGGFNVDNSKINITLENTTEKEIAETLIKGLNLQVGFLSLENQDFPRGVTLQGNIFKILKDRYGNDFFIEDGKGNIIKDNNTKGDAFVRIINKDSGLLETPRKQSTKLMVKTLFEPQISINELINIESTVSSRFNGTYKVIAISHNGIISETQSGTATTDLELLISSQKFIPVPINI